MNANTIKGDWKKLRGKLRAQWGKLTDSDLDLIAGKRDQLIGTLQKHYGMAQEDVEEQLRDLEAEVDAQLEKKSNR